MNPLAALWKGYLRWRHSHGFGVHSPYAYHLVTTVVRPGDYGYYGYHPIERIFRSQRKDNPVFTESDIKLILRLVLNMKASRLVSPVASDKALRMIKGAARIPFLRLNPFFPEVYGPGDLLCLHGHKPGCSVTEELLSRGVAVIAFDPSPSIRETLEKPMSHGLLFSGKRIVITIPRREMAYVDYSMKF